MTNKEKEKIIKMLDDSVEHYYMFRNRDDYPDKPCVRREVATRQLTVFNLSDYLYHYGFITWEQCCEYWNKVELDLEMEKDEKCPYTCCGANINGVCKYTTDVEEDINNDD